MWCRRLRPQAGPFPQPAAGNVAKPRDLNDRQPRGSDSRVRMRVPGDRWRTNGEPGRCLWEPAIARGGWLVPLSVRAFDGVGNVPLTSILGQIVPLRFSAVG